jgi:hypothetical protein
MENEEHGSVERARFYLRLYLFVAGFYLLTAPGRIGLSDSVAMLNVAQSVIDERSFSSEPCEPDVHALDAASSNRLHFWFWGTALRGVRVSLIIARLAGNPLCQIYFRNCSHKSFGDFQSGRLHFYPSSRLACVRGLSRVDAEAWIQPAHGGRRSLHPRVRVAILA